MWCCEDPRDEIWRNQAAINRHFGIDMGDLARSLIVPASDARTSLWT